MGKKQHSKDQLYLTATEWQADWGGKKHALHLPWKTLPYNCCAISFRPFETPMCTRDGDATLASDSSDFLGIRRSTSSSDAPKRFSSVFLSFFTSAPPSWRREAEGRTTGSR